MSLQALKPSISMLSYLATALGIYAVLFVLSVIAHSVFDITYLELSYPDTTRIIKVDVVTYLFVGAALLIFFVLEQIALILVLIVYWIFNSFIVGRDPDTGLVVVPFALFQVIGLLPFIGEFFKGILPLPMSALTDFISALKTVRSLLEILITGGFAYGSETIINFIEETIGIG